VSALDVLLQRPVRRKVEDRTISDRGIKGGTPGSKEGENDSISFGTDLAVPYQWEKPGGGGRGSRRKER